MFLKLEAVLVNKESNLACLFVHRLFSNSRLHHHLVFKWVEMQAGSERGGKWVQIVCFGTSVLWDPFVVIFSRGWKGLPQGKILKFTDKSSPASMSIWALIRDRMNYFPKHVPQIITDLSKEIHALSSIFFRVLLVWAVEVKKAWLFSVMTRPLTHSLSLCVWMWGCPGPLRPPSRACQSSLTKGRLIYITANSSAWPLNHSHQHTHTVFNLLHFSQKSTAELLVRKLRLVEDDLWVKKSIHEVFLSLICTEWSTMPRGCMETYHKQVKTPFYHGFSWLNAFRNSW